MFHPISLIYLAWISNFYSISIRPLFRSRNHPSWEKHLLWVVLMFILSVLFVINHCLSGYSPQHILNPRANPEGCMSSTRIKEFHRRYGSSATVPSSWIYDADGYLELDTYLSINEKLTYFQKETDAEVAILIVDVSC